jgi:hypothetical protein
LGEKSLFTEKKGGKEKWLLTEKLGENRSQTRTDSLFMQKESYYSHSAGELLLYSACSLMYLFDHEGLGSMFLHNMVTFYNNALYQTTYISTS